MVGFVANDVSVTGSATVTNFISNSSKLFTFYVMPSAEGLIEVQIPSEVATDPAGNPNLFSNSLSFMFDTTAPTAVITTSSPSFTASNPVLFTVTFSEAVSGFDNTTLTVTTATATVAQQSDTVYIATLSASVLVGTLTIEVRNQPKTRSQSR